MLNLDWQGKLISARGPPDENQTKIFNNFKRIEIFEHGYDADHLFELFYSNKAGKPKRQPNAFMIMRAILGLVADKKKIKEKLGDGMQQSKLAGLIWGGASNDEKGKFRLLATQFKKLHVARFPDYTFKPRPRSSEVGAVVDIKTAEDYQNTYNWPSIPFDSSVPDSPPIAINTYEQTEGLDRNLFINGYNPLSINTYEQTDGLDIIYGSSQQFDTPSIAVNCLSFSRHPYDPSSTFHSFDDRNHTLKKSY